VTPEQARAQLELLMTELAATYPATNEGRHVHVLPMSAVRFHPGVDAILRPYAVGLAFLASLMLLTACANVASLLLVRAAGRPTEMGVRLAIGATRGRLVRQVLTESLTLSGIGSAIGFGLAWWIVRSVETLSIPLPIPIELSLPIDRRALMFSIGTALCTGMLAGVAPAVTAWSSSLFRHVGGDMVIWRVPGQRWTIRDGLVSAQIAITVVLLVSAALLVRSLLAARTIHVGLPVERLAVIALDTRMVSYADERSRQFFAEALARIRALPGVERVALASRVPFSPNFARMPFWIPGRHAPDQPGAIIELTRVSPDYFSTIGVPIVQGRGFTDGDQPDTPRVAVINQTMARRYWPDESPIGRTIRSTGPQGREFQIVGVSADYKVTNLGETPPFIHQARQQQVSSYGAIIARTRGDARTLLLDMQRTLLALEPQLVFVENNTLEGELAATQYPILVGSRVAGVAGLLALALAAIGLYGVIAYAVAQRTRELAIRMAVGAHVTAILRLVAREGLMAALAGLVVGWGVSAALVLATRASLAGVLVGIDLADPVSWTLPGAIVLAVSILASSVPAWRAVHIAPAEALRME
jgi:predicted permease